VRKGPLFDIRGSLLAVISRTVPPNQHPHFLSNCERRERSMSEGFSVLLVGAGEALRITEDVKRS
jgi:hypothetical protein